MISFNCYLYILLFILWFVFTFYFPYTNQNNSKYPKYQTNQIPEPCKCNAMHHPKYQHPIYTINTNTKPPQQQQQQQHVISARLCCQSVPMVYKSASTYSSNKYRRYLQMADNQNEDEQAQLLGEEGVRANQPGQNLKLG